MDFKFSKGNDETPNQETAEPAKKKQTAQAILLLIIVGAFAYIYFFTGIIRPQPEEQKPAPPAPQVVKKPLPPKEGETPKDAAKDNKPAEAAKVAAATPPAAPTQKAATPAPVVNAVKPEAVKPQPQAEKPKPPAPKQPTAATVAKPSAKPEAAKNIAQQPQNSKQSQVSKQPQNASKAVDQKKEPKAVADAKSKKENSSNKAPQKAAAKGSYSLVVGEYTLEEALAADMVKVRKAGLEAEVKAGGKKKSSMNRLNVGEFDTREAANSELAKLKKVTSDAFIIDSNGKYILNAGSYLVSAAAIAEKSRLEAAGFKVAIRKAEVAIPAKTLSAGTFKDKKSADAALKKLKEAGLKPVIK